MVVDGWLKWIFTWKALQTDTTPKNLISTKGYKMYYLYIFFVFRLCFHYVFFFVFLANTESASDSFSLYETVCHAMEDGTQLENGQKKHKKCKQFLLLFLSNFNRIHVCKCVRMCFARCENYGKAFRMCSETLKTLPLVPVSLSLCLPAPTWVGQMAKEEETEETEETELRTARDERGEAQWCAICDFIVNVVEAKWFLKAKGKTTWAPSTVEAATAAAATATATATAASTEVGLLSLFGTRDDAEMMRSCGVRCCGFFATQCRVDACLTHITHTQRVTLVPACLTVCLASFVTLVTYVSRARTELQSAVQTALPPQVANWSRYVWSHLASRRLHLPLVLCHS